jgi:hypothetical protein
MTDMTGTGIGRAHQVADELFERHRATFGTELPVYRGHVHRVIGLVGLQLEVPDELAAALGLATFFHDAGLWFDGTWDYLPPSIRRATAALGPTERGHAGLVAAIIDEHHRIRHARHGNPLVEAVRRADLTDITAGLVPAPGVSRADYRGLVAEYPAHGFRPMLLRAFGRGLRESPLHPAPMIKL